jgi:hypothetical protein
LDLFYFLLAQIVELRIQTRLAPKAEEQVEIEIRDVHTNKMTEKSQEKSRYTHLKIASLVCILFSGELFGWLLNFDEMYL